MHFSAFLAASAATLAAAAPVVDPASSLRCLDKSDLNCNAGGVDTTPGAFNITNFVFGCTSTCNWNFNAEIVGSYQDHPAIPSPFGVYLHGDLDENTDYVDAIVTPTQNISAYIVKGSNLLKLKYTVVNANTGATIWFYGEQQVYAATSEEAELQEPNFLVNETLARGVSAPPTLEEEPEEE